MEDHRDVLVLSGTRIPIGKYGGGLAAVPPCDLAATVVRAPVRRAGVERSDVGHADGAESMGRGPYWLPAMRWGQRMQDGVAVDAMVGALTAAESHRRAAAAATAGYFTEQITPVEVPGRKGTVTVDADEHIRPGVTTDDLARLRPAFAEDGTVTAGNASGVNDAAAAVVLTGRAFAERHGHSALGRLVATGMTGPRTVRTASYAGGGR